MGLTTKCAATPILALPCPVGSHDEGDEYATTDDGEPGFEVQVGQVSDGEETDVSGDSDEEDADMQDGGTDGGKDHTEQQQNKDEMQHLQAEGTAVHHLLPLASSDEGLVIDLNELEMPAAQTSQPMVIELD